MSKHTPGPWAFSRWDEWGDTRFYIAQADGAPYTPNYSDVATLVAETCIGEKVATQEANARLIAAAPELLEALELLTAGIESSVSDTYIPLVKARAAIAKATGEKA